MNKTIQALKDSITHWENLRDGKETKCGAEDCALCDLFQLPAGAVVACRDCPVRKKTGEQMCHSTPYHKYRKDRTPENAQKEVDFLKDVLIEELERFGKVFTVEEEKPDKESGVDILSECKVFADDYLSGASILFTHNGYFVCRAKIDQAGSCVYSLPSKYKVSLDPFRIRLRKE